MSLNYQMQTRGCPCDTRCRLNTDAHVAQLQQKNLAHSNASFDRHICPRMKPVDKIVPGSMNIMIIACTPTVSHPDEAVSKHPSGEVALRQRYFVRTTPQVKNLTSRSGTAHTT
jgi:hypothetical protein